MAPPRKASEADVAALTDQVADLMHLVAELQKQLSEQAKRIDIMEGRQAALQYRAQELTRG